MADDIDLLGALAGSLAGTRRRAVVAKVLREEIPRHLHAGVADLLHPYVQIARAVLLALDEHDSEQEPAGALDQSMRLAATQAVSLCRDVEELAVNELIAAVERVVAYIRDGKVGE